MIYYNASKIHDLSDGYAHKANFSMNFNSAYAAETQKGTSLVDPKKNYTDEDFEELAWDEYGNPYLK